MAITKEMIVDRIEVLENGCVQAICKVTHTPAVISSYEAAQAAQGV